MKKLLFILTLLFSLGASAQILPPWLKANNSYGNVSNRQAIDSTLLFPTGCGAPTSLRATDLKRAAIYYDSCNKRLYLYDPKRSTFDSVHVGAITGTGLGSVTSVGSGFGLQGGPITGTGTLVVDTTRGSGIPTYWYVDSLHAAGGGGGSMDSSIFATIHRVDSLNALYARAATTLTINGVAQTIAANRTWSVGTLVGTDTVSLSNRINAKLNITDTTSKWISDLYKKPGTDSIFQNKGGVITFKFRTDSTSGGGGSPNTSVGSGFKVAINGTNNIKSITASQHIGLDSLTSNQLNIFADTTKLATKLALVKARDSVQTNVNLKADKSTTISAGTGIGSGLGDISANRTVNVDTSVMLTKLAGVKMRDSVQTNVNAKLNITDTANIRFRPFAGSNVTLSGTYPNITISASGGGGGSTITDSTLSWVTKNGDSTAYRIATSDTIKSNQGIVHGSVIVGDTATVNKLVAYFFGTSITQNIGTATNREIYWALISDQYNWAPYNKGVSATTLVPASGSDSSSYNRWVAQLPTYNAGIHGAAFIEGGTNDCGSNDTTTFKTYLGRMIDTAVVRGWPKSRLFIIAPPFYVGACSHMAEYATAAMNLAATKGVTGINDYTYMSVHGGSALLADGVHPNPTGYSVMAGSAIKAIPLKKYGLFRVEGEAKIIGRTYLGLPPNEYPPYSTYQIPYNAVLGVNGKAQFTDAVILGGDSARLGSNAMLSALVSSGQSGVVVKEAGVSTSSSLDAGQLSVVDASNNLTRITGTQIKVGNGNLSVIVAGGLNSLLLDLGGSVIANYGQNNGFNFNARGVSDANTLFAHAGFSRVGIGTATPAQKLTVTGSGSFSDSLIAAGKLKLSGITQSASAKVLHWDPSTNMVTYADTTASGGGGGGIADPGSNGILARTALNTTVARTITGTTGQVVVTNGTGVSGDPTLAIDTTKMATKLAVDKARDSVQVNVNLKADKSITIAAGTGIGSGLGDLSSNRTVNIDTSVMATKLALAKARDSVQVNVNLKADKATTITTSTGLTGGGDFSTNRTHAVDTSVIATKLALAKARDSVQINVNLKADKATTITAGTGIGGGLGDLSANRTVNVDTSVMATKLALAKARDSVQVNVNTKANSSLTISAGVGIDATGLGALTANRTINIDTSKMETKLAMKKTTDSLAALIGSGGGGVTPTNVGSGYRWVIPNGGQIKTLINLWGTYYDSTSTTLGIGIDTSDGNLNVATQGYVDRAIAAGGGGGGETNTASSVGGGLSLYAYKGGADLKFRSLNTNHFDTASNLASLDTINGPMSSATGNGYMKSIDYKRSFTAQTISNPTGTWTFDVNAGGQGDVSLTSTGGLTLAFSNIRTGDICLFRFNNTSGATITLTLPANSFLDGASAATLTIPTGRSQISLSGYDGTNSFFSSSSGTFATASNNLSFFSATTTKQFIDLINIDTVGTIPPVMYAVVGSDFTLSAASGVQTAFPSTQDVWTLAGSTTYEVEGHYFMTTGTTTTKTTAIAFALAGGASVTTINLDVIGSNNTANTTATAQGSLPMTQVASTVVTATATTAGVNIHFKGIIITNARGTWTPQINFSANPGGTNLMKAGSYIKFTKLGTSAQAQIGNVN